jgi:hypothetical protein
LDGAITAIQAPGIAAVLRHVVNGCNFAVDVDIPEEGVDLEAVDHILGAVEGLVPRCMVFGAACREAGIGAGGIGAAHQSLAAVEVAGRIGVVHRQLGAGGIDLGVLHQSLAAVEVADRIGVVHRQLGAGGIDLGVLHQSLAAVEVAGRIGVVHR